MGANQNTGAPPQIWVVDSEVRVPLALLQLSKRYRMMAELSEFEYNNPIYLCEQSIIRELGQLVSASDRIWITNCRKLLFRAWDEQQYIILIWRWKYTLKPYNYL